MDEKDNEFCLLLERLSTSLTADGEGAGNAAAMIFRHYSDLFYHFPDWSETHLIPLLQPDHAIAEAAWQGIVAQHEPVSHGAFKAMKPALLALLGSKMTMMEDNYQFWGSVAEWVVIYAYWSKRGSKYLSDAEVRFALRSVDNNSRADALGMLLQIFEREEKAWPLFGRHFFKRNWPLESALQTQQTSSQLLIILVQMESYFDQVLEEILPLLTPMEGETAFIDDMLASTSEKQSTISNKPHGALLVLDRIFPDRILNVPYNLKEALDLIVNAAPELRLDSAWLRLDALCRLRLS